MRNYYIFKFGNIKRKDDSIMFEYEEQGRKVRHPIPVNDVDCIYLFGEISLNTKVLNFFSQNNIMLHFFNYYGFYTGTFYPREFLNSGEVIVKQAQHYTSRKKRLALAKEFVTGAIYGAIQNLKHYRDKEIEGLEELDGFYKSAALQQSVPKLMGIEGNAKELYYRNFPIIINQKLEFKKRVKNPPDNMMNALISFVNSMIYTETLKEIYKTQLNPTISYLHKPGFRRFSLALDVAEIFKPIFGDRIIFDLINNNVLQKKHFDKDINYAYMLEEGRKLVVQAFDKKLNTTVRHRQLGKQVAYRRFIRLELYKLVKHILGEKEYSSLRIWW